MSMEYVRRTYGVPAKRGMVVEAYYGGPDAPGGWKLAYRGKITSASHYVHLDGIPFHPTHNLVYLDRDGRVLLDTRSNPTGEK